MTRKCKLKSTHPSSKLLLAAVTASKLECSGIDGNTNLLYYENFKGQAPLYPMDARE